jgi:tRNA(Arg) A34 adenosine deaminase TadA
MGKNYMLTQRDEQYLRIAIDVARRARERGNHPFGAVLAAEDGTLLLEAENTVVTERDCTGHAETNLMRRATQKFDRDFLLKCTLYTSTEPCAMCSGAIYWGNVGRVVFALSEERLYEMTGSNPENPTLSLPCREVFARGQRTVEIVGPALEDEARKVHEGFWN